MVAAIKVRR